MSIRGQSKFASILPTAELTRGHSIETVLTQTLNLTVTFHLKNEWQFMGRQVVTTYQVWSKNHRPFCL